MTDPFIAAKAQAHRHLARNHLDHKLDQLRKTTLGPCGVSVGPVPKLDGEKFSCVRGRRHPMPHQASDGTWWEPPARRRDARGRFVKVAR